MTCTSGLYIQAQAVPKLIGSNFRYVHSDFKLKVYTSSKSRHVSVIQLDLPMYFSFVTNLDIME